MNNRPSWWTDTLSRSWEQAREALRRDRMQTRHDLHLGGHELNQNLSDTVGQAIGEAPLPPIDVANRPTETHRWEDAEIAIGFGYAARTHYGDRFPTWCSALERRLKKDWKNDAMPWRQVVRLVRHGYEVRH